MESITVLLPNCTALILRADDYHVDDGGYLHVSSNQRIAATFSPGQWIGVYETAKGTL